MSLSIIFAVTLLVDTKVFTPAWLFDGGSGAGELLSSVCGILCFPCVIQSSDAFRF